MKQKQANIIQKPEDIAMYFCKDNYYKGNYLPKYKMLQKIFPG